MVKSNSFTFIDLFAGIGGFRIALEKFGGKCVFSSEWDKFSQETYQANFGEIPSGDITKIDEKTLPNHDILCAGFPCQAFSISGKQKGFEDTRGTLFFDLARIIKECKPKVLFLENVKNFAKHDNGKTLEVVLKTLNNLGYDITYKVINASQMGGITSRQRLYFVGFRKDLDVRGFEFPTPYFVNQMVKNILETNVSESYSIVRNDIHITKVDTGFFQLQASKPLQIGYINKGGQGERIYSTNGHAITLSAHGGGAAAKTGAYLVDGIVRKLTPRECARVMGFPESFQIPVSNSQAYKQFGNSVVVPVIQNIFSQIYSLNHLWLNQKHIHQNLVQVLQKQDFEMNKM
jgi:DNA (cytosine-5)-methyltransferase 1